MARSGRLRSGAAAKLKRWRKGHSSDCNPETRQHRLAARSRFCSRPTGEGRERAWGGVPVRAGASVRAARCLCQALSGGGCRAAGVLRDEPLGPRPPRAGAGGSGAADPELQPGEAVAANRGAERSPQRSECVLLTFTAGAVGTKRDTACSRACHPAVAVPAGAGAVPAAGPPVGSWQQRFGLPKA